MAWKENFLLAGEALDKREEAERILADYEQKAEQVGQQFGDPAALRVSMLRFIPTGIRLYGEGSFIGTILSDAGFARPQSQQVDKTFVEISREQLSLADGDLLFYASLGETEQDSLTAGPLWQGLDAVSSGRARALPDGLATVVGAGGHRLSATQAQQLALVRLVLADPLVAILDEATAEAGSAGARVLEVAALSALDGRTALVVAHRLTQAATADRIVVLDAGRVVEIGTHTELANGNGPYAQLWTAWSQARRAVT